MGPALSGIPFGLSAALADRYRLERELGHGGMATVYLAQDLKHKRPVALKVLNPELSHVVGTERFRREIETAAQLDHPHILPVHDSGEAAGQLWYTMPYVDGETLRGRMQRQRHLPVEDALRLAREVADALEYAHRHGVVHRDVKPENILLSGGHARVADFGIAKAVGAAGSERLTGTGLALGTPAYMSPEQASGGLVDGRSDQYSLACVLYEMLAGEPPFTGSTPQAVIGRRFVEPAPTLRSLKEAVPSTVEAALARALALDPGNRFSTAAEFAEALNTADVTLREAAAAPAASGKQFLQRMPGGVMIMTLVTLLGVGLFFAWRGSLNRVGTSPDPKLLAVLPFENLSDTTQAYFAEGVSNAVRGKLAALPGLRVIAGASSSDYRHTTKPPQQIARELGVRYLLLGTVLREGGSGEQIRVQVSAELVEVGPRGAPTTKWQEPIEVSLGNIFQLQTDLARGVAEALGVRLGAPERLELAESPTRNLAAYNAYLRGEQISSGLETSDLATLRRALPYYEQAIALDSTFVQAWTQLARARASMYGGGGSRSPADAEAARAAAERALALAPDRPEGRHALGDYYLLGTYENSKALEQYTLALKLAPDNVTLLYSAALAEQSLGRWDQALEHFHRAYTLNPRSVPAARALAYALLFRGRGVEALATADRALALEPNVAELVHTKAMMLLAQGDLAGAQAVIRSALKVTEPSTLVAIFGLVWDLYWALEEPEQQLLLRLRPSAFDDSRASWGLILAQTYAFRRDQARARIYADSARLALEEQLKATPDDPQLHGVYGLALAYLGRKADAVREGEQGVSLAPLTTQTLMGPYLRHQLVRIYLLVGEPEKALDRLEELLRVPYFLSPGWLRIDPNFAPLRGHPRFERLLAGR